MPRGSNRQPLNLTLLPQTTRRADNFPLPELELISASQADKRLAKLIVDPEALIRANQELVKKLDEKYEFVDQRTNRTVFYSEDKSCVYKVANAFAHERFDLIGCLGAIFQEAWAGQGGYPNLPVAKTHLVYHKSGLPILIMEAVDCSYKKSNVPKEVLNQINDIEMDDQIGKSIKTGEWVVYDAGMPHTKYEIPDTWPPLTHNAFEQIRDQHKAQNKRLKYRA